MRDSGIEPTDADRDRWGCAVGTGMMGVDFDELAQCSGIRRPTARSTRTGC